MKLPTKIRFSAGRSICGAAVAIQAILAVCGGAAIAGTFTPGNLVILRDGAGVSALSSTSAPVFLDQYTTSGTLVSSEAVATNGPAAFVNTGNATTEGVLTLSPNKQYLVVGGYSTNIGVAAISGTTAATAPRTLATVDFGGNVNLAVSTTTAFSADNIRSGTTDGNGNFWAVGSSGGVNYLGTGAPATIAGTILNDRVIQDIGGNLYYSSGSGTRGVYEIIGNLTSGSTVTNTVIPTGVQFTTSSSPYAFVFNPGMTVAYVADSAQYTAANGQGGIEKWTLVGPTWTYAYTLGYGTNGAYGLAADFSGANPVIYATSAGANYLFAVTDLGTGGTNGDNATLLATAAANEAFRGLSFAPINVTTPPAVTSITPTSVITNAGATATLTVSATGGAPLSYYWYFETATSTNLIPGATGPTLTLPNLLAANSGNYQVVISNISEQTATSPAVPVAVGGLVILRDGTGVSALSATSAPVFLDQYTTSGTLVSSESFPTNGPNAFVDTGNATTEGVLTLSTNGQYVVVGGYNTNIGVAAISGTTAAAAPRALATVDSSGNIILAATTTTAFSADNIRSGTTDGNGNYWAVGSSGGMNYLGTGTPATIAGTILNDRMIQDIGGNLYYSSGSGSRGVYEIIGTPTSGSTITNTVIPTGTQFGTASSPYAFVFNPGMTVAYVADSTQYTGASGQGGIEKWTLVSGNWTYAYTLGYGTNGAYGLTADFTGANPVIYTTSAGANYLFKVTDLGVGGTNGDNAILLATAAANEVFRGLAFAPTNIIVPAAPVITAINPVNLTTNIGSTVKFTLTASLGNPAATAFWYAISGTATNLVSSTSGAALTLTNVTAAATASYFAVLSNASGSATSSLASLTVTASPTITDITPSGSYVTNAGQTVTFTLNAGLGSPAANVFWYETNGSATTLIAGATNTTLTLANVVGTNSGGYFAILTNSSGAATSSVVSLTVIDPILEVEPASAVGLVDGTVQFAVTVAGTAPLGYQWYFSDTSGDILSAVGNGVQADHSVVSGATSSVLTVTNLQTSTMLTNYVVVVTNVYGSVTSTVASLLSVTASQGMLALWDFDGSQFTNRTVNPNSIAMPAPFIGDGTALSVGTCNDPGTSPLSGATDPSDVAGVFTPYGFPQLSPNFSWGTENYPAVTGTNKANGVQFNVSTVGAKNIMVAYDSRVSSTASEYERLQYTTNGVTWIDYPSSSTFDSLFGTGNAGYYNFSYSLVGFPGVENNPNFGIRIVTEWQSTATYQSAATMVNTNNLGVNGVYATNFWVGTDNSYAGGASGNSAAGTVTYDLVAITGDAITNNNVPPSLGAIANTNMVDTNTLTLNFVAVGGTTPPDLLTYNAEVVPQGAANPPASPNTINPSFTFGGSGTNRTLTLSFAGNPIPDALDAGPILVTATDAAGDATATWFVLTASSINQPPTNSLTATQTTNLLANGVLTIPFTVGSVRDATTNFMFNIASDNNTVIPMGNVVISGNTNTGMLVLTITPAPNEVGNAKISVSVTDNDPAEPRTTTANIETMVRPNTNVFLVDNFNYDGGGALDLVASAFWNHLSGINQQLQEQSGYAVVNALGNTENVQARLLGSPYQTNSAAILYASFFVNMQSAPIGAGSYFTVFNDGSGITGDVECRLVATTNDVETAGDYRLGINNFNAASGTNSQIFPQDLALGSNYLVMVALNVASGFSTLWVSPTNQYSPSVTDTTPAPAPTNLYNISDFELRESGDTAGTIDLSSLTIGSAFNSVYYPALANPESFTVGENSTNVLAVLTADAGSDLSITSVTSDTNATATISGTNITFVPTMNFTGISTVGYAIKDDLGNVSSATISVTVTNTASVTPIPVSAQYSSAGGGSMILSWSNPAFSLQTTTNLLSPWITVSGATSPYTNTIGTNAVRFYRLVH